MVPWKTRGLAEHLAASVAESLRVLVDLGVFVYRNREAGRTGYVANPLPCSKHNGGMDAYQWKFIARCGNAVSASATSLTFL